MAGGEVRLKVGNVWVRAIPYMKINGTWKVVQPWSKAAGVWRRAT